MGELLIPFFFYWLSRRKAPVAKPATSPKIKAGPGDAKIGAKIYLNKLAKLESGPTQPAWDSRRPNSQYWGRWQLGRLARNGPASEPAELWIARGVKWDSFKADPALQTAAATYWSRRAYRELRRNRTAANAIKAGVLHGLPVTWSGLVGFDHLVGRAAVLKWIRTGQDTKDANGVGGTVYLSKLGGLDLAAWNPTAKPKRKASTDV